MIRWNLNMNINQLKLFTPKLNLSEKKEQRKFNLVTTTDTFEKRTSNVMFKANPLQQSAKEILTNENLTKKFAAFMAAGFATLTSIALGNKNNLDNTAEDFTKEFLQQQQHSNEQLEENEDIIDVHSENKVSESNNEIQTTQNTEEKSDTPDELVKANFPKKRGRLSAEQTALKNVVETLQLKQVTANKLFEICQLLINTKDKNNDQCEYNIDYLINNLSEQKENMPNLEKIIDEVYKHYKEESQENNVNVTQEYAQTTDTDKKDGEEVYIPNGEKEATKPGVNVVGKTELEELKQETPAEQQETPQSDTTNVERKRRPRIPARVRVNVTNSSNPTDTTTISILDVDIKNHSYTFKFPGTVNPEELKNYLSTILKNFEEQFSSTFYPEIISKETNIDADCLSQPKWLTAKVIQSYNLEQSIKNEITKRESQPSPYKNIKLEDAPVLAEIINSDPRFKEFFTLHAALRFIDRIINFNEDDNLHTLVKHKLDLFLEGITKSLSQEIKIEPYVKVFTKEKKDGSEENETKVYWGPRVVIKSNKGKNPELFEISGSFPLIIGLSEEQSYRYNKINKKMLISTIFFKESN